MISKASSKVGGINLFLYVINEDKGYELDRANLCGVTAFEIYEEMRIIQELNQKVSKKVISIVFSPDPEDSKNMSKAELKKLSREFLQNLGVDLKHDQFLNFVHLEKNPHCHIVLNRVRKDGTLIKDNFISLKAQKQAHLLARKYGYNSARDKMWDNKREEKDNERKNPILQAVKQRVLEKHKEVLAMNPKTLENYIQLMHEEKGVIFTPYINRQGELQGFRVKDSFSGLERKASKIHRTMSLHNLIKSGLSVQGTDYRFSAQIMKLVLSRTEVENPPKTNELLVKKTGSTSDENLLDVLLKPNYTSGYDPFLYEKKKRKKRKKKR